MFAFGLEQERERLENGNALGQRPPAITRVVN